MNLEDLPPAVEMLHDLIIKFRPMGIAMEEVLAEFDVTEEAVRARFEAAYRITLEELGVRFALDHTIEGYLDRFRETHSNYHPSRIEHLGKRFYLVVDDRRTGREIKKWHRFLISHGLMIVVVNELTLKQGEIGDNEIIDDIAWQIGWKRWSDWPEQGPQPSRMFPSDVPT